MAGSGAQAYCGWDVSEHDRPRRARSHPLGVPTTIEDEGTGARRSRLATMQAFQAAAEPIVKRVDGLEGRLDSIAEQLTEHTRWVRDNELAKANQRAADHHEVVTVKGRVDAIEAAARAAGLEVKETKAVRSSRRWDVAKMVIAPLLTFVIGLVAARIL